MLRKTALLLCAALCVGLCCLEPDENELPPEFQDAVPRADRVWLNVPGADDETIGQGLALKGDGDTKAKWYLDTIGTARELNAMTWSLLHFVEDITGYPYTDEIENGFVWGPFTPAESKVTIKFTLVREGHNQFSFALMMRPTLVDLDGDGEEEEENVGGEFTDVLTGAYMPQDGVAHSSGNLKLIFDTFSEVDRTQKTTGVLSFEYDTTGENREVDIIFEDFQAPDMEEKVNATYHYSEGSGRSGEFGFDLIGDIHKDDPDRQHLVKRENLSIFARWMKDGSGRADVRVTGGDLPTIEPPFESWESSECWDELFNQVYLQEQANPVEGETYFGDPVGDESACVFAEPQFR